MTQSYLDSVTIQASKKPLHCRKILSTPSRLRISMYLVGPDRAKVCQMIINREVR